MDEVKQYYIDKFQNDYRKGMTRAFENLTDKEFKSLKFSFGFA
jgi:hypothetical protein